jgi:hypothetical protein
MTTKEKIESIKQRLIEQSKRNDIEDAHGVADDLLCELLRELGQDEIVDIFENMEKWYS